MADTTPPPIPSPGAIDMIAKLFGGGGLDIASMMPTSFAAGIPFIVPAIFSGLSMLGNKTSQEPPTASLRFGYDDNGSLTSPQNDFDRNTFWGDTLDDPFTYNALGFGNYGRDILNPLLKQAGVKNPQLPENAPTMWQGGYNFGGQQYGDPNSMWHAYARSIPGVGAQMADDYFGGLKTNPDFWDFYNARYDRPTGWDTSNPERGAVPTYAPLSTDWTQVPNIAGWSPAAGPGGGQTPNQSVYDPLAAMFPVSYMQPGGGFGPAAPPSNWTASPTGTFDPLARSTWSMKPGGETTQPMDYARMWGLDPNLVNAGG